MLVKACGSKLEIRLNPSADIASTSCLFATAKFARLHTLLSKCCTANSLSFFKASIEIMSMTRISKCCKVANVHAKLDNSWVLLRQNKRPLRPGMRAAGFQKRQTHTTLHTSQRPSSICQIPSSVLWDLSERRHAQSLLKFWIFTADGSDASSYVHKFLRWKISHCYCCKWSYV